MTAEATPDAGPARPALFIDKDGTLVENIPYNADPARLRFMPGALEALANLALAGYALVLVTNQSGLARGYFGRAQFKVLLDALQRRLWEEAGLRLDALMVCPHAPGPDGAPACLCRKPAPGMLTRAAREHRLDLPASWIVGDTLDDVEAGHRAGCRAALLDSGGETVWRRSPMRTPDLHCHSWAEFARELLLHPLSGAAPASAPTSASSGVLVRELAQTLDQGAGR
jgi:D-glycero-D-manno-heptose 1,7-bisphosphate phosphatase